MGFGCVRLSAKGASLPSQHRPGPFSNGPYDSPSCFVYGWLLGCVGGLFNRCWFWGLGSGLFGGWRSNRRRLFDRCRWLRSMFVVCCCGTLL